MAATVGRNCRASKSAAGRPKSIISSQLRLPARLAIAATSSPTRQGLSGRTSQGQGGLRGST